jgi:hypothetical protein
MTFNTTDNVYSSRNDRDNPFISTWTSAALSGLSQTVEVQQQQRQPRADVDSL